MPEHTHGVIYELRWQTAEKTYRYVGQSVDLDRRVGEHRKCLKRGNHCNPFMSRVWAKHGDFEVHVLEQGVPVDDLASVERRHIEEIWGQEGCLNGTRETVNPMRDPAVRERQAEALRAMVQTEEWRAANKAGAEKRAQSPEWRAKNKAANQRLAQCPEWQKKHAAAVRAAHNKAVELTMPNNEVLVLESLTVAAGEIGVPETTLSNWLRSKKPWPGQGQRLRKKYAHLVGLRGRYL
jgi:group I intron endonuclease